MADVKITLKKSLIGCKKPQIATAEALGLHKVGDTTTQPIMHKQRAKSRRSFIWSRLSKAKEVCLNEAQ